MIDNGELGGGVRDVVEQRPLERHQCHRGRVVHLVVEVKAHRAPVGASVFEGRRYQRV